MPRLTVSKWTNKIYLLFDIRAILRVHLSNAQAITGEQHSIQRKLWFWWNGLMISLVLMKFILDIFGYHSVIDSISLVHWKKWLRTKRASNLKLKNQLSFDWLCRWNSNCTLCCDFYNLNIIINVARFCAASANVSINIGHRNLYYIVLKVKNW